MQTPTHFDTRMLLRDLVERLVIPLALLIGIFLVGTFGYVAIGWGRWTLLESAYMTSITLTTVGYGEVLDQMGDNGRIFTMFLMWSGMGVTLYALSTVTAFVVERHLSRFFRERKMEKRIAALNRHVIICGAGKTGSYIVNEFLTVRRPCCLVVTDPEEVVLIRDRHSDLPVLTGDPTEEEILLRAGIKRASGIIANLEEDSRNLLITVMAAYINPEIKIVARAEDKKLAPKFEHAGAHYVVTPSFIGGMRMASEMLRPHVVTFLDRMLRGSDPSVRVEEVTVQPGSQLGGSTLGEANLAERTGLNPIALRPPGAEDFTYNPSGDLKLESGAVIIVIGGSAALDSLRELCEVR